MRIGLIVGACLATVALPLVLRMFVIEAFKVPSGAMKPTIQLEDHLFVTKSSYGLFSHSAPERGEVVVFIYPDPNPAAPRTDFIKRVIALPGDTLQVDSGAPIINGWKVPRCWLGRATLSADLDSGTEADIFVEFLQGHAYLVLHELRDGLPSEGRSEGPYSVAPGEFWVLGDNRNNSADSRSWRGGRGAGVPFDNLVGRAWYIWHPPGRAGINLAGAPALPDDLKQLQPALERCLAKAPSLVDSTPPPPR